MAVRLGSYPVLILSAATILFAGCHEPTTPSSHQAGAPATPDASAADAHGWGAFYPLAVGNRWEYATRVTVQLVPPTGPPGATISADGDLVHEMVCADDVTGRGYVFERASWQQGGQSGELWITSRQDRSGLYELDGASVPASCVGPSALTATRTAAAAAARARAWQTVSSRITDARARAAWLAAWNRAEAKLAALDVALGRGPSGSAGGPLASEITRLSYPLHPGATWIIRSDGGFRSTVEALDNLTLAPGRFNAYRIRINSDLFGPNDQVHTWYGSSGYLGLEAYIEQDQGTDPEGNPIGIVRIWQSERLVDLSIGNTSAPVATDPIDVQVERR